ncbi:excisionase [Variovorax paradoxus]|nr:excisionase [Variovorax paradoxus]
MSITTCVTIKKAEELTGYTEKAINTKIDEGVWRCGKEWHKAPDGRRIIDIEGYERWVKGIKDEGEKQTAQGRRNH